MRLYFIRHAQSTNNALADQTQRVVDPALTPTGEQQAQHIAKFLKTFTELGQPFRATHLYTSALLRTLQTSQPIAQALGMPLTVWRDIYEAGGMYLQDNHTGKITGHTGMTRQQIATRFPETVMGDDMTENGWWQPERGMETNEEMYGRAIKVCHALRKRAETDERIVIVSHGLFLDALLKAFFNQLPATPHGFFYLHYNTGITRLDFHEKPDDMRLHFLNRVDHLPFDLRTA